MDTNKQARNTELQKSQDGVGQSCPISKWLGTGHTSRAPKHHMIPCCILHLGSSSLPCRPTAFSSQVSHCTLSWPAMGFLAALCLSGDVGCGLPQHCRLCHAALPQPLGCGKRSQRERESESFPTLPPPLPSISPHFLQLEQWEVLPGRSPGGCILTPQRLLAAFRQRWTALIQMIVLLLIVSQSVFS